MPNAFFTATKLGNDVKVPITSDVKETQIPKSLTVNTKNPTKNFAGKFSF